MTSQDMPCTRRQEQGCTMLRDTTRILDYQTCSEARSQNPRSKKSDVRSNSAPYSLLCQKQHGCAPLSKDETCFGHSPGQRLYISDFAAQAKRTRRTRGGARLVREGRHCVTAAVATLADVCRTLKSCPQRRPYVRQQAEESHSGFSARSG